ncbi:MAG: integrin alpha [Planctomycetota bacterium]
MHSRNTHLLTIALLASAAAAQTPMYTVHGPSSQGNFGGAVQSAGDVNADDLDDLIVGSPAGTGRAMVLNGSNGSTLWTVTGDSIMDRFGTSVSGAGDVDGDGHDDFIVGAPNVQLFATGPGYARLFSGRTGAELRTFRGTSVGDQFGAAVAGAGDANDDGYADVIVGGPSLSTATLYSGRDGAVLHTLTSGAFGDLFGAAVCGAGDVNRDGHDDVAVGAPNAAGGAGSATVYSGRDGSVIHTLDGQANEQLGSALALAGDVNGDGRPDLVVGMPGADEGGLGNGAAAAFSGVNGSLLFRASGTGAFDRFGSAVAGAGDINGDGRSDIVVGAPQPAFVLGPTGPGYARAVSGTGATLFTITGDGVDDGFGSAVCGAGDVNGDHQLGILVGAPGDDDGLMNSGMVRLFAGPRVTDPGRFEDYGAGCPGSSGRLPNIGLVGNPRRGLAPRATLRAAPASQLGILRFAFGRDNLDLGIIGMPNCTLLTQLFTDLRIATDASGRASVAMPIPTQSSLQGLRFNLQWSILDAAANPLGIVMSDAGEITIG